MIPASRDSRTQLTSSRTVPASSETAAPATDGALTSSGQDQPDDTDDSLAQHESARTNNDQKRSLTILARTVGYVPSDQTRQRERRRIEETDSESNAGWDVGDPFGRPRGDHRRQVLDERQQCKDRAECDHEDGGVGWQMSRIEQSGEIQPIAKLGNLFSCRG